MGWVLLAVVLISAFWVGMDAKQRDWSQRGGGPVLYVFGTVILWILCFPLYLYERRKAPLLTEPSRPAAVQTPEPTGPRFKACPDCAETVLAEARVCKHCGFRFGAPAT